jgi:hypothetical protein
MSVQHVSVVVERLPETTIPHNQQLQPIVQSRKSYALYRPFIDLKFFTRVPYSEKLKFP